MITEKRKAIIAVWSFFVIIGVVFFILGLTLKLPPKELAYYSNFGDTYEVEEYVNGDAYNYIIAASQWAGEYSARSTEKTIYICFGIFMFTLGLANIIKCTGFKKKDTNEKEVASSNIENKDKSNLFNDHSNSPINFRKWQQEYQNSKETKVETTDQTAFDEQSNNNK